MELGGKMAKIPMNLKEFGHLSEEIISWWARGRVVKD